MIRSGTGTDGRFLDGTTGCEDAEGAKRPGNGGADGAKIPVTQRAGGAKWTTFFRRGGGEAGRRWRGDKEGEKEREKEVKRWW